MEFLDDNPDVKEEAKHLMTKFEDQIEKLRKTDVQTYRRKIEQAPDLEAKSRHIRRLLETNIPASVDLLDRLLQKSKNDKLEYLEWMSHRQLAAMSLESFSRAKVFAEEAYSMARNLYENLETKSVDAESKLPRKATYKAYINGCVNLLLVCRFQGKVNEAQTYLEEAKIVAMAEKDLNAQHQLLILHGDLLLARAQLNKAIEEVFSPLLRNPNLSLQNKGLLLQKFGNACRSAAQWGPAKDYLRESIKIAQDLEDHISEFDRVTDLGNVYRSEGRIADALEQQVSHMAFSFKRGDLWGLTVACFNMGFAYYSITPNPDLRRALILLCIKHDLASQTDNEPLRGMALNNLGKVFCAYSHQYEAALKVLKQSAEIARKTQNVGGEGMAYGNMGTVYRFLGLYKEAIEYHTKYLLNASGRGDDGGVAIMQRELTIDYLCQGDFENAERQVRDAISTLETIRNKLGSEDASKIANFDKNQAETYSLLQIILSRQGKHAEALALSDLARSRALTDIIRNHLIKTSGAGFQTSSWIYNADFASRWQDIVDDIISDYTTSADELNTNFLIYSVVKDYDSNGVAQQWLYIWIVLNEHSSKGQKRIHFKRVILNEKIQGELLSDSGFFASLTRSFRILSDDGNIPEMKVKKESKDTKEEMAEKKLHVSIPDDPDVKEFLAFLESMSLTKISSPSSSIKKSPDSDTTRDICHESKDLEVNTGLETEEDRAEIEMERLIERGSWAKEGFKQLLQLYEVCIAPVDCCLPISKENDVPNVTIIPHEFLFSVPFCCLHDANEKYLVERYVLSYAPSLRALLLLNQRLHYLKDQQGNRNIKVLAMGDPTMVLPGIKPLPCSGEEAKNVQAVFGSDVCQIALRFDATKKRLLKELRNIDILHLATHASPQDSEAGTEKSGGDYSMRGCLLLASSDEDCEGVVEASEISSVDCTCQLVMLSCCETGLGKLTGDGVVGLYRAFFASGAASVIVTLWKIRDDVTPVFMDHFYNAFKATGNASGSLRSAMLFCIHEKKLPPHQWAAFSFIGAFTRVEHQPSISPNEII